jgi:hypothetical protein
LHGVTDCKHVGKGEPALEYLSRYLYRGVISENNIIANRDGKVTFRYIESKTGKMQYRTLKGEDFLCLANCYLSPEYRNLTSLAPERNHPYPALP